MRDIKIEPRDKEAAKEFWNGEMAGWREQSERQAALILAFARHRQAAEKAQQERDAGIADAYHDNCHHDEEMTAARNIATAIRSQGHE